MTGFSGSEANKPTRAGLPMGCPRAASGHTAAAPPRKVMNSRRFIRSPRRRGGERRWDFEADSIRSAEIDNEFEFNQLVCSLENAPSKSFSEFARRIDNCTWRAAAAS